MSQPIHSQPQGYAQPYGPGAYPPTQNYAPGAYGQPPMMQQAGVQPPIMQQDEWASAPAAPANCPPGLEYLTAIDQLLVHQKVELLEVFTRFEANNKYTVKNSMGQKVFYAVEDTDSFTRNCCGPARPFDMKILDSSQREVIHLYRPLRCICCCCFCCLQRLEIMAPPGNVIGYVVQEWSVFLTKFRIQDATGTTVLRIEGPFCPFSIFGDVEFQVLTADGKSVVGKITKQWSGLAREMFTDADNFGISFPLDLDVNIKAVLLGACFLIDFMFFEGTAKERYYSRGMLLNVS